METVLSVLDLLKWPLVIIVIALIFKKPITSLINSIKSIKGGKFGIETELSKKQLETQNVLEKPKSKMTTIEKSLNLISDDTRNRIQTAIIQETELDKVKDESEKNQLLLKYSEALYVILRFERIYNLIFGSQIKLLNHLNSSIKETTESISFFYKEAVEVNPNLKEYPYKNYLAFLESEGLIIIGKENSIQISAFGRDLLKYMIDSGLSDKKYN